MKCAVFALGVALVTCALCIPRAQAQSCCGVAGEDELSVAGFDRRAVLTSKLGVEHMLGHHDRDARYHGLGEGVEATDAQLVLGAGVRMPFYEPLQLHGSLPVRVQHRALPAPSGEQDSALRLGMGDASVFARWSALRDDERGLFDAKSTVAPSLDLFIGVKLPSGVHDEGGDARALARTMGDGVTALIAGVRAIKYVTPEHAIRLSLRYDLKLARDASGASGYEEFSPGDTLGLTVGYLGTSGMRWAFGVTADAAFTLESSARTAGGELEPLAGTAMHEITLGAHLTHLIVMPELDLTLGVAYTPPIAYFARNTSLEGVLCALTLRWHFMPI
jgi:hypothetical protein